MSITTKLIVRPPTYSIHSSYHGKINVQTGNSHRIKEAANLQRKIAPNPALPKGEAAKIASNPHFR
jgi:hypothetical protein